MKIIDGTWSLVTVGKWNKYILNPNWVGKNIFNEEKIRVDPLDQIRKNKGKSVL